MSPSTTPSSASSSNDAAWRSLVNRSICTWYAMDLDDFVRRDIPAHTIYQCNSLDEFLMRSGNPLSPGGNPLMLWFFQIRTAFLSQKRLRKWSREDLDDYILLPATMGFVLRRDCFFISHFWHSKDDPDPDGEYLRLNQAHLKIQPWSYVWVDWTCMPQGPRSLPEEAYFHRCLQTMSGIIRNCGFTYFYPPFEPRLWILYEITEYTLTCDGGLETTPDVETFLQHIDEMVTNGVTATLKKHNYRCSYDRDRRYLTSWLELLVLFKRLRFDIDEVRNIMDHVTWFYSTLHTQRYAGGVELRKFEGTLEVNGKVHNFTPFPKWDVGKFSTAS